MIYVASVISMLIGVAVMEAVRTFLPEGWKTGWKPALISAGVLLVAGIVGAIAIKATVWPHAVCMVIAVVAVGVAFYQVFAFAIDKIKKAIIDKIEKSKKK